MRLLAACLAAGVLATACSPTAHVRRVDAQVDDLLGRRTEEVLGDREARAEHPEPAAEEVAPTEEEHLQLDLSGALEVAVASNRDYRTRLEDLRLTAISLLGTRHRFAPQLEALLSYALTDGKLVIDRETASGLVGASQILPTGGTLSLEANASTVTDSIFPDAASVGAAVRLSQPLLRGAGYEVSHESLVQAERSLVYEVRDFELFREDFAIDVAARFYGLVRSGKEIENQEENLEKAIFDRRKAQALADVGRFSEIAVLRAKRQELNSQNALIAAQESYEQELDAFRIFLGLPETVVLEIADDPPTFVPVSYDAESAVRVALSNRLDALSRREQLEDASRAVRIARDGLRADLDLDLSAAYFSLGAEDFEDVGFDRSEYRAALNLGIPLDRVNERNAYRSAQISEQRARRDYELFEENVRFQIRSAIRELERRQDSVQITRELIVGEERNKRIAELQFERGDIDNRELVDAEQSLLNARNELIDEQVNYELARLRLLRDLGILFIDDRGMWKE